MDMELNMNPLSLMLQTIIALLSLIVVLPVVGGVVWVILVTVIQMGHMFLFW